MLAVTVAVIGSRRSWRGGGEAEAWRGARGGGRGQAAAMSGGVSDGGEGWRRVPLPLVLRVLRRSWQRWLFVSRDCVGGILVVF